MVNSPPGKTMEEVRDAICQLPQAQRAVSPVVPWTPDYRVAYRAIAFGVEWRMIVQLKRNGECDCVLGLYPA